jgi:hypothetical protein
MTVTNPAGLITYPEKRGSRADYLCL